MSASFRVFSLNFEGDKLSPWPFLKGTIPIAVRDWRNGAAWLKPCNHPQLGLGQSSLLTPSNMPSPLFFVFSGYTGSNTRMPLFKKKLSGHLSAKSHRYEGLEEWNIDTCDKFIRKLIYININILKNILD